MAIGKDRISAKNWIQVRLCSTLDLTFYISITLSKTGFQNEMYEIISEVLLKKSLGWFGKEAVISL